MANKKINNNQALSWHIVEDKIISEINWLMRNIDIYKDKDCPIDVCRSCLLRKIAIMIVSGQIQATKLNKTSISKSFWSKTKKDYNHKKIFHGNDWHQKTMRTIENHYLSKGYHVIREQNLHWGRADLGVYKKNKADLLIEVGTTSFYKIWYNLQTMHKFIYLIVPNNDYLIEFIKSE